MMVSNPEMMPVVLGDIGLLEVVRYIIDHHSSPTTLVVCSTRDAFLQELLDTIHTLTASSLDHQSDDAGSMPANDGDQHLGISPGERVRSDIHPLLLPTLHLLSNSRTVDIAFCPDLTHLLAYLSVLSLRQAITKDSNDASVSHPKAPATVPMLAILNPIRLHRPTSSFSAQGMNRTFAAAAEIAYNLGRKLIIAECGQSDFVTGRDDDGIGVDEEGAEERDQIKSVWDEEVSILNVTTKSFGAGQRGWVGRTVTIRRVAERWCRFETYEARREEHGA